MLLYHHCRPIECITHGIIKADPNHKCQAEHPNCESELKTAYSWLEKQVGFTPLFLSVGNNDRAIEITAYQNNWMGRIWDEELKKNRRIRAGEQPNNVLFSFEGVQGKYMDYDWWNNILCSTLNKEPIESRLTKETYNQLFIPRFTKKEWLKTANSKDYAVQIITPEIDLRKAKRIWVRNMETKKKIEKMGFENVKVKRVDYY